MAECCTKTLNGRWQQVVVQEPTHTNNSYGEPVESWGTHTTCQAILKPLTPREVIQGEMVKGELPWTATLRYSSRTKSITTSMRLIAKYLDDKILYVAGPPAPMNGEKKYIQLLLMEQSE